MTEKILLQTLTLYYSGKKNNRRKKNGENLNVDTIKNEIVLPKIEIKETTSATLIIRLLIW